VRFQLPKGAAAVSGLNPHVRSGVVR
jgi:hypothetical protein